MPTILLIYLSDHFPGTKDFSYTDISFWHGFFSNFPFSNICFEIIFFLQHTHTKIKIIVIVRVHQQKLWMKWHHLLWRPRTVVLGKKSCCTLKTQNNFSDKYTQLNVHAIQYIGKTAAISSKHLEQINWTVPELTPALPWSEDKILLLGHLPLLPHKTRTQTLSSLLSPVLPLTYLPSKLDDSIKILISWNLVCFHLARDGRTCLMCPM